MHEKTHFFLDYEQLPEGSFIPNFQIYVYDLVSGRHTTFLHANTPLSDEKRDRLKTFVNKGAKIAVRIKQEEACLAQLKLKKEDIPSLVIEEHELEIARQKRLEQQENNRKEDGILFLKTELHHCIKSNDFSNLIIKVRDEILLFDIKVSPTTTLAIKFADNLLNEDSTTNRIVVLSYLFATSSGIKDYEALGDLVSAAFLHKIGFTQIDWDLIKRPQTEFSEKQQKEYRKHPGLAQHLIRKGQLDISARCLKIILEHKEQYNGEGYPYQKKGQHLDRLSLILSAASHIIEYSSGNVTSGVNKINSIMQRIVKNNSSNGLILDFGPQVNEILMNLAFSTDDTNAA